MQPKIVQMCRCSTNSNANLNSNVRFEFRTQIGFGMTYSDMENQKSQKYGAKHSPGMSHFAKSHDPKLRLTISSYSIDFLTWFTISRTWVQDSPQPILVDPVSLNFSSVSFITAEKNERGNPKLTLHARRKIKKSFFSLKCRIRFKMCQIENLGNKSRIRFQKAQEFKDLKNLSIMENWILHATQNCQKHNFH